MQKLKPFLERAVPLQVDMGFTPPHHDLTLPELSGQHAVISTHPGVQHARATLSRNTFGGNRNALYLGEPASGGFENNVCTSVAEDILLEGPNTELTLEGNRCPKITTASTSSTPDFRRVLNLDWGYTLNAPDSWKLGFEEKAGVRSLSWVDPQNPRVKILLQVTRTPTSDALSGWYEVEADLQRRYGTVYQRIVLEPSSVIGSEDAAR